MWRSTGLMVLLVLSAATARGEKTADELAAEYEALQLPAINADKLSDPQYLQEHNRLREEIAQKQSALAQQVYELDPAHPKAGIMLTQRWMTLAQQDPKQVLEETQAVIDREPHVPARADALYIRVALNMMGRDGGAREAGAALIEQCLREYPDDPRWAMLLYGLAEMSPDPAKRAEIEARLEKLYPDSFPVRLQKAEARKAQAIGKPFELEFTDAITGERVSVAQLKGKLVVIDFWATWCGPCVAAMPELKQLYADYHDEGLEIIGVSLDRPESEGGLAALQAFVKENQVLWPQYYQGAGWEGEFSSSWGIRMVPTVFIVDPEGNLVTTEGGTGMIKMYIDWYLKKDR